MNVVEFKQKLFEKAQEHGFSDVEMYYEKTNLFNCEIDKGEVDKYATSEEMGVSFRGLYSEKMGYAYSEKLDNSSIDFLLQNAKENALIMEDKDQEEIFEGSEEYKDVNFYSEKISQISNEDKVQFMQELDQHIYAYDERVVGTGFFTLQSGETERALFNNKGLSLKDRKSFMGFGLFVIVKEGEVTKTGSHFELVDDFTTLNAKNIAEKVVKESLSYLNSKEIQNRQYQVLLRHDAAASLFDAFTPIFSAENAQQGMSLLKEKEGTKIAGDNVTLIDDPFKPNGLASRTFDAEGVASRKISVIENGKLQTLLHNQKTAKKAGVETTGHAYKSSYKGAITVNPSNFYLEPGEKSYNDILKDMDEGVIITELSGLHSGVNKISGDFSVAAKGYYVKNGSIETATNQLTIAGNFFEMLNNIDTIGSDLEFLFGSVGSPSLLINQLSVTSE